MCLDTTPKTFEQKQRIYFLSRQTIGVVWLCNNFADLFYRLDSTAPPQDEQNEKTQKFKLKTESLEV